MLTVISVMTFTLYGSLYPVFLWTIGSAKMGPGFHRFTLGLSSLTGGIGVVFFWLLDMDLHLLLLAGVWYLTLLAVTWFYWNRPSCEAWVVTIPCLLGLTVYVQMVAELISSDISLILVSILGGLVLSGSVFSMVLGHWYLNVVKLPIGLLRRSVNWLLLFLILRSVWDLLYFFQGQIDFNGYMRSLVEFIQSFDGFFLFVALFFGTALPVLLCLLVLRTIAIRSTQAATGLLYIVVISAIMGDLFYKYYALEFGLFL